MFGCRPGGRAESGCRWNDGCGQRQSTKPNATGAVEGAAQLSQTVREYLIELEQANSVSKTKMVSTTARMRSYRPSVARKERSKSL